MLIELIKKKLVPRYVLVEKKTEVKILEICEKNGISTIITNNPNSKKNIKWIRKENISFLCAIGFSKILSRELLDATKLGAINCHGGDLPYYRGASPIPWQIINGENKGSASILCMTEGIDDGPIIKQEYYDIDDQDNATTITDKVNKIFIKNVPKVISSIFENGKIPKGKKQSNHNECYWTRRVPSDGLINWKDMNVYEITNMVRALTSPYPGAYSYIDNKKIIFYKVKPHPILIKGIAGRYVGKKFGYETIICKNGAIAIEDYTIDGAISLKYGDTLI